MRGERQRERDHHRVGHERQDVAPLDLGRQLFAEIDRDDIARAELGERVGQVDDVLALRDPDRGRREEHQRHQRHHERWQLEAGDEEAVEQSDQHADEQHRADARDRPRG